MTETDLLRFRDNYTRKRMIFAILIVKDVNRTVFLVWPS